MNSIVVLDWKFLPLNYFEEPIEISRQDYTMTIADGQAQAKIDSAIYQTKPDMRKVLHEALNDRFLGVQLFTHRAYELSRSTMTRVHPGGRREILCEGETGRYVVSGSAADFRVTGKDENVIADSKRDRVEEKRSLAELIAFHRPRDTLLAALLRSYEAAVNDPNNELVHLYEIRDALAKKFESPNTTQKALGISGTQWSHFGRVAGYAKASPTRPCVLVRHALRTCIRFVKSATFVSLRQHKVT